VQGEILIQHLPSKRDRLDFMDLFTDMEHHGCGLISEMDMEMAFVKCFLVAEMIEKYDRERNTGQKGTPSKLDTPLNPIDEEFVSVKEQTSKRDV